MIQTLIAPVANLAGTWLASRAAKSKAKQDLELAIIQNKTRLALSETEANHEWEMAQLQDKDKWLRYFSYSMFTAPIVVMVVAPEHGKRIFENLEYVPSWLVEIWIALNGAIWGLSSLKGVVPSVIGSVRKR